MLRIQLQGLPHGRLERMDLHFVPVPHLFLVIHIANDKLPEIFLSSVISDDESMHRKVHSERRPTAFALGIAVAITPFTKVRQCNTSSLVVSLQAFDFAVQLAKMSRCGMLLATSVLEHCQYMRI